MNLIEIAVRVLWFIIFFATTFAWLMRRRCKKLMKKNHDTAKEIIRAHEDKCRALIPNYDHRYVAGTVIIEERE